MPLERRSDDGTIPFRMSQVEAHMAEQRALNAKLTEGLWALRTTLETGMEKLDTRIAVHDKQRAFWGKIALAVVTSLALTLVAFLIKISIMVQGARTIGGG